MFRPLLIFGIPTFLGYAAIIFFSTQMPVWVFGLAALVAYLSGAPFLYATTRAIWPQWFAVSGPKPPAN